jgi:hypothetical protein
MAAVYLKDYKEELRKVGDVVFKQRYRSPVLIVTGRTGDFVDEAPRRDKTMIAAPSGQPAQSVALLDRVFAVTKATHAPRGPIVLGRSGENDIPIPEFSISKRHCYFEFEPEGITVTAASNLQVTEAGSGTKVMCSQLAGALINVDTKWFAIGSQAIV